MKDYLEKRIAYCNKKIPEIQKCINIEKNKSQYFYDIEMKKLFDTVSILHECKRQLKALE